MSIVYEYRTIRFRPGAWTATASRRFGLWRGEVGFYNDEGAVLTGADAIVGGQGLIVTSLERLEATLRPVDPTPPTEDGLYVHRWFEVRVEDVPRFLELSGLAWPGMEAAHPGVRIIGLWRSIYRPDHLLLITRYADLAQWERSRYYNPNAPAEGAESRERFRERARLTQRTIARFTRLVSASE